MASTDAAPAAAIKEMMERKDASRLLYVAAELGLADHLAGGPRTSAALAAAVGAERDALHRLLRAIAALGVVEQLDDGRFGLTPLGATLCGDAPDSTRAYVRWQGHPMWLRAWASLIHTVRTGEPAFEDAFGMGLFAYLNAHPDIGAVFDGGMAAATTDVGDAIVAAYDFASLGSIVDVGGGNGALLAAILRANPQARGTILDQPHTIEGARATIAAAGLAGRCASVAGDFFASVPAGADAYVLKWILHDWDDARCVAILRAIRRAMPPDGRLLVVEQVLPDGGALDREAAMNDITMLALLGSRERTAEEYRALFVQADLRLTCIVPMDAGQSIVEGATA